MVARLPQPRTSSRLTLDALKYDLAKAYSTTTLKLDDTPIFAISTSQVDLCPHESELTILAASLIESMLSVLQYGTKDMLEEYFNILKDRALHIGSSVANQEQIIIAQNILSSYAQSSFSLCQLYNWIYNHQVGNDIIQTVLTHTCTLLIYAVGNHDVSMELIFIASVIIAHWKTDLSDVNFARLYIILIAAKAIGALSAASWGGNSWGTYSMLLESCEKGCWGIDLYLSSQQPDSDDFKKLWKSVREYTWDTTVDLFKDAKIKRRVCERARSIKLTSILSIKEVNRITTEQLHPIFTDILTMCRAAMNSKDNLTLQTTEQNQSQPALTKTSVFQKEISPTVVHVFKSMLESSEEVCKMYASQVNQLQEENDKLKKECQSYCEELKKLREYRLLKELDALDTSAADAYTEKDILDLRKRIEKLEAENLSLHKYANSAARHQEYISQLKQQMEDLNQQLKAATTEKQALQEIYDDFIAQQQVIENEAQEINPHNPLTDNELIRLKQLRVYGIAPDTAAMSKLCSLMPSSKIVLVGQNMSMHEDIPANYDLYFFVTALAGHKVYNKWRSKVKALKVPYCHCNSSGLNIVARQILHEYDKQILNK